MNYEETQQSIIIGLQDLIFFTRLFDPDKEKDYSAYEQKWDIMLKLAAPFMEKVTDSNKGRPKRAVVDMETGMTFDGVGDAADYIGCPKSTARKVCIGEKYDVDGYILRFKDEV